MRIDQPTKTLPKISNKQEEILKFIYHFRFLNRIQIQALLNHKDPKTINLWLKDLNEKDYLNRIYSTKFGENTKPAVYYIGVNGIKYLKAMVDCPKEHIAKLHREKDRSDGFSANCQLLADIYLELRNKDEGKISYKVVTSTGFLHPGSPYHFLKDSHVSLVIERAHTTSKKKNYFLLEIISSSLPGYSIRKRIKDYLDFYYSNDWEDNVGKDFPAIILICETLPLMLSVRKMVARLLEESDDLENLNIAVTSAKDIREHGIKSELAV